MYDFYASVIATSLSDRTKQLGGPRKNGRHAMVQTAEYLRLRHGATFVVLYFAVSCPVQRVYTSAVKRSKNMILQLLRCSKRRNLRRKKRAGRTVAKTPICDRCKVRTFYSSCQLAYLAAGSTAQQRTMHEAEFAAGDSILSLYVFRRHRWQCCGDGV